MTVLVVGGGGREHALVWKIAQSPRVKRVLCAPGNAGTASTAENFPVKAADLDGIVALALREKADLVVVGPDDPLAAGLVDRLQAAGVRAFGPTAAAARFEASKSFAKDFMLRHGIPAAASEKFTDYEAACAYARLQPYPLVVKADGLALGKGVTIAEDFAGAERALRGCLVDKVFGDAGRTVVIEEFLSGRECSVHALVDGKSWLLFPDARDHKRALDGDRGPNTGGMGTLSPSGRVDDMLRARIEEEILAPFVRGLRADGIDFRGMLFPGLMLTAGGPKVLEFNARFGDPETQVLLPRLKSDLPELLEATIDGRLDSVRAEWDPCAACCVIMASGGYPGDYRTGVPIEGLESCGGLVFHAGTKMDGGRAVTSGGRVLGVTATGETAEEAVRSAYAAVGRIRFDNAAWRTDIGSPDPA
ncbi:MAG: phosphoribosylamine--glycine ligase [Chthoniobacterales bacterium]|jgi:phosphoribosylamine--glycine ligase